MYENYLISFFLISIYLLFSGDLDELVVVYSLKTKVFVLNCFLFARSYLIYRKICKDLGLLGIKPPPFSFIPIERRQP